MTQTGTSSETQTGTESQTGNENVTGSSTQTSSQTEVVTVVEPTIETGDVPAVKPAPGSGDATKPEVDNASATQETSTSSLDVEG